jgi:uncharacterized protein (TIGR02246 family)
LKKIFAQVFILTLIFPLFSSKDSQPVKEIEAVLDLQREAWNAGDIDGFMALYWRSDKLTFQSGNTRLQGWEALLARYKKAYPEGSMGKLAFSDLIVDILTDDTACVLGRWKLETDDQPKGGLFTIILKRMEDGWKIIHDHTS